MSWLSKIFQRKPALIIAARVTKIAPHPNADRLRLIELFDGQNTIAPVVCGAFNFAAGDMVVLAKPGARIAQNIHSAEHEPFVLQKATIRGVESQGMICAAFELGLSPEPGKGIMILRDEVELGSIFTPSMLKAKE